MPRASGTAGVVVGAQVAIFSSPTDGDPCTTFAVRCRTGSAVSAAVNIPQLHGTAKVPIPAGATEYFRCGTGNRGTGLSLVNAEGVGGNATIDYWVVAMGVY